MKELLGSNTSSAGRPPATPGASLEFMIFGDAAGTLWAFPRAHLISAKIPMPGTLVLNFSTHRVVVQDADYRASLKGLLAGELEGLMGAEGRLDGLRLKRVMLVEIEAKK